MSRTRRRRPTELRGPRPSIPEPRAHLLGAVRHFVRKAAACDGVIRIAMIGSLATTKPVPKDADLVVTIHPGLDLAPLARIGRSLQGACQHINLGADIFLAEPDGGYIGRICGYRECHARALCRAQRCGVRQHLNDDLHVITLAPALIAAPPIELWPHIVRRAPMPPDVEQLLLAPLRDADPDAAPGGPPHQAKRSVPVPR